ncbi:hypothetical protein, partial [Streptomyces sp. NBC_00199]|uniref:hypothetical protein n=1 Tax=Streptomyces sp. NBC_00199 TaxID=2975678 RepID=UPI00225A0F6D
MRTAGWTTAWSAAARCNAPTVRRRRTESYGDRLRGPAHLDDYLIAVDHPGQGVFGRWADVLAVVSQQRRPRSL